MRAFSRPRRAVAVKVDPEMLAALATTLMNHADEVRRAGNSHRTGPWYDLEQLPHSLEGSQLAAVSAEAVAVLAGGGAQGYVIAEDEFASLIRNAGEVA